MSPNFEWALMVVTTRRNIAAGTTCTSSRRMKPHSRDVRNSIIFLDSCDLLCVFATIEYVDTTIPLSPANYMTMRVDNFYRSKVHTFSFWSAVNTAIWRSVTFDHCMNCCFHCITDTLPEISWSSHTRRMSTYDDVHSTRHDFFIVHAAVIPTSVFPAPQGKTMMPERARLHATCQHRLDSDRERGLAHSRTSYSD